MSIPNYLTEDDPDFEQFDATVKVTARGTVRESLDPDEVREIRADKVQLEDILKRNLIWSEDLGASIINVEAWLHGHWMDTTDFPEHIQLDEDRTFFPDFDNTEVTMNFTTREIILASRQRAAEDRTHFLYVLGNWTYLAMKNDHVSDSLQRQFKRCFEEGKEACFNPPGDATVEEHGGGRYE